MDAEYKSRKVGLIIFGVIQILIGGMCALALPMMLIGMLVGTAKGGETAQMSARMMIPGLLFYLVAAVWFIWLGIGSAMTRRWARALILVTSWMALIGGMLGIVFWIFLSPQFYEQMAANDEIPAQALAIIRIVTTVILSVMYVVGPAAFVLFYRSRHVKATVDALDPKERWTDKCPLPVLALVVLFAFWATTMISMGAYGFAMPFFGIIASGALGAVVCLGLMAAGWWTAIGMYRLKMSAWWTGVSIVVLFYVSSAVTFSRVTIMDYYEAMSFPAEQLELMGSMNLSTTMMFGPMLGGGVLFLGYMIYARRFFKSGAGPS